MTRSSERRWLVAIVFIGLALRVAAVVALDVAPESDYFEYQAMALSFVRGDGFVDSTHNLAFYSIGYPLLVLAPVFAVFGEHLLAVQLVNAGLSTLAIVCCYGIARAAGAGMIGRLTAAASFAVYLPSLLYAEYLAKENLMTPLLLGVVWCTLGLARRPATSIAVVCGCLFGLLALTGNSALVLAPVALLGLFTGDAPLMRKLWLSALAAVLAFGIAAPWMIRNARVVGAPVLNTNGGFNLYLGNNPLASGMFMSIRDTPRGSTWHALRAQGELHASNVLGSEATAWMKAHPGDVARLALRKVALFWTPPMHDGLGPGSAAETLVRRLWLVQFVLLALAAVAGIWLSRTRYVVLIGLAIATYTAVHALYYVIFRYREPAMPLLCVLTGLAIEMLVARGTARSWTRSQEAAS